MSKPLCTVDEIFFPKKIFPASEKLPLILNNFCLTGIACWRHRARDPSRCQVPRLLMLTTLDWKVDTVSIIDVFVPKINSACQLPNPCFNPIYRLLDNRSVFPPSCAWKPRNPTRSYLGRSVPFEIAPISFISVLTSKSPNLHSKFQITPLLKKAYANTFNFIRLFSIRYNGSPFQQRLPTFSQISDLWTHRNSFCVPLLKYTNPYSWTSIPAIDDFWVRSTHC